MDYSETFNQETNQNNLNNDRSKKQENIDNSGYLTKLGNEKRLGIRDLPSNRIQNLNLESQLGLYTPKDKGFKDYSNPLHIRQEPVKVYQGLNPEQTKLDIENILQNSIYPQSLIGNVYQPTINEISTFNNEPAKFATQLNSTTNFNKEAIRRDALANSIGKDNVNTTYPDENLIWSKKSHHNFTNSTNEEIDNINSFLDKYGMRHFNWARGKPVPNNFLIDDNDNVQPFAYVNKIPKEENIHYNLIKDPFNEDKFRVVKIRENLWDKSDLTGRMKVNEQMHMGMKYLINLH